AEPAVECVGERFPAGVGPGDVSVWADEEGPGSFESLAVGSEARGDHVHPVAPPLRGVLVVGGVRQVEEDAAGGVEEPVGGGGVSVHEKVAGREASAEEGV